MNSASGQAARVIGFNVDNAVLYVEPMKLVDDPERIANGLRELHGVTYVNYMVRDDVDRIYFHVWAEGETSIHAVRDYAASALHDLLAERIAAYKFQMDRIDCAAYNMLDFAANVSLPAVDISTAGPALQKVKDIDGVSHVDVTGKRRHQLHLLLRGRVDKDRVERDVRSIVMTHVAARLT